MTEYAVTVCFYGDYIVEAESAEAAEAHVESIMDITGPDSDFYLKEIEGIREEES